MNRVKIILRESETLREMLIGVSLSNIVILLIALIICKDKGAAGLGALIGYLTALFYTIHMAVTIDDALYLDEKGAMNQIRKHMLIRYLVVCLVIAFVSYFGLAEPLVVIFSILTVKLGAYLQPVVHGILHKNEEGTTEEVKISEATDSIGDIEPIADISNSRL